MYNIRRGSNLRFSDHMSSLKTALRSSDTCLILDFSTTRSSSTFDVAFEEVCDENGGKSDKERETTKVIEDIRSDLGLLQSPFLGPLPPFAGVCGGLSNDESEEEMSVLIKQTKIPIKQKKTKYLPQSMSSSTLSILTLSRPMSISAFSLRVSAISNFAISSWSSSW